MSGSPTCGRSWGWGSTLRSYQEALRLFCAYVTDPAYGWPDSAWERFGTTGAGLP